MKILVVSQYFWPENFRINEIVINFLSKGHSVDILTGYPNYPDGKVYPEYKEDKKKFSYYHKAKIHRVPVVPRGKNRFTLITNYITFILSACFFGSFKLRGKKIDTIFVFAPSPISVALPAILISKIKKAPLILWVLDLWPETLAGLGVVKKRGLFFMIFRNLVKFIYNNSKLILCQSKSFIRNIRLYTAEKDIYLESKMEKKLFAKVISDIDFDLKAYPHLNINDQIIKKVKHFPAWPEEIPIYNKNKTNLDIPVNKEKENFNILFAGNIGEAQDFPSILEAAKILKDDKKFQWLIVGGGRMFLWLKKKIKENKIENNIQLFGYHKLDRMPYFYSIADVLLVTLRKDSVFEWTIPGKIQSYLTAKKPIVGMLNGEGASVIQNARAGMTCKAGDYNELANILRKISSKSEEEKKQYAENANDYAEKYFKRETLLDKLDNWMSDLANKKI